ncbi:HPr family phosphocarrier protein [Deinococcus petrolearius]|uniref:HPr family phosphocarrier protein n=1 Tax=Deinococcus petrolearius TaxID=1751295 RepID=A0ABW1DR80_9DEIO
MTERRFRMTDPQGMHARPASAVVKVAKGFSSDLTLVAEDSVSLKNMMKILSQGIQPGTAFTVQASGEDEAAALQAIADVLRNEGLAEEV